MENLHAAVARSTFASQNVPKHLCVWHTFGAYDVGPAEEIDGWMDGRMDGWMDR